VIAGCNKRHIKFWHAIRRLISVSWLVAAALVIVFLIFVLYSVLKLTEFLVGLVFGPEAADAFVMNFFMAMEMLFWVAIIGVPIYALVSYAKHRRNR
jgi:hypothetical protein